MTTMRERLIAAAEATLLEMGVTSTDGEWHVSRGPSGDSDAYGEPSDIVDAILVVLREPDDAATRAGTLALWAKREEGIPARVQRRRPDDLDYSTGAVSFAAAQAVTAYTAMIDHVRSEKP